MFSQVSSLAVAIALAAGCGIRQPALTESLEARRLAGDLRWQFARTVEAGNRAVMVGDDTAARGAAREAETAAEEIERTANRLASLLQSLRFSDEASQLDRFRTQFAEYRGLDREMLPLAAENTNLKAQRLSFGPARQAAADFHAALERALATMPASHANDARGRAWEAYARVLEALVTQSPHIAEAQDAAMTRMEKEMEASLTLARQDLTALHARTSPRAAADIAAATTALDEFAKLKAEIVLLSRRNSNVRSLALSIGRKRTVAALCEDLLNELNDALTSHSFTATR